LAKSNSKTNGPRPSFKYEGEALKAGASLVAGIDEAGRGPLAGPVVAAAVILAKKSKIQNINDSKLVPPELRQVLYQKIIKHAVSYGIGIVSSELIDEINIYQATRLAMNQAVEKMQQKPDFLLIDGKIKLDLPIDQKAIVKGDQLSLSVAAASILAKVTRDRIMVEMSSLYPDYGFHVHKGYATKNHRDALCKHGPCPIHRKHFKGVKDPETLFLFEDVDLTD
jgi:ribonuclease HII